MVQETEALFARAQAAMKEAQRLGQPSWVHRSA